MTDKKTRAQVWVATQLYRWSMSQTFVGTLFSALTFSGVFTILLGPVLQKIGIGTSGTLFLLIGVVVVLFLSFGFFLDRVLKFWKAQAIVGTTRNPFLISRLYQKEALGLQVQAIPLMKTCRALLATGIMTHDRRQLIEELDRSIARLEQTVQDKEWVILPGEDVYETHR